MIFTISYSDALKNHIDYYKSALKNFARQKVALYPFHANEILMDRYLQDTYNISLKVACLIIVMKAKLTDNFDGRIIVNIKDKNLDMLARLITFGTGRIKGSNILRVAFDIK